MDVTASKATKSKTKTTKKTKAKRGSSAKTSSSGKTKGSHVLMGLDLGTYLSCYATKLPKPGGEPSTSLVPTVVGYAEDGILSGILPGNSSVLFGEHAIANDFSANGKKKMN